MARFPNSPLACLVLAALLLGVGVAPAAPSRGDRKVLGVRVTFADANDAPSQATILEKLNSAKLYFGRHSYGQLNLLPEVAVANLPNNRGSYSNSGMKNAAENQLRNAGYNLSSYAIIGFYPGGGGFGSHATVGGSQFVASNSGGATLHEMGHNLGFGHQSYWKQEAGGAGPLDLGSLPKPDPFHFMSGNSALAPTGVDPEPYEKWKYNWLGDEDLHNVTADGSRTFRLYTFDQKDTAAANNMRAIKIVRGNSQGGQVWCGFRSRLLADNYHLRQGLALYWRRSGAGSSALIDAHPWSGSGTGGLSDHALQPGETWSDGPGRIHITNLGRGGTEPDEYLDVRVNRGAFAGNQPPAPTWDAPSQWTTDVPLTVTVTGNDPDGDEVACMWTTTDRANPYNTSSTTLTMNWATAGNYTLKVVVTDMKGETSTLSRRITVGSLNPATRTWDRGDGTNKWHEAANWTGNTIPLGTEHAAFDGRSSPSLTVNADAATTVFNIIFSGGSSHWIQSDNSVTWGRNFTLNGNLINNATATQHFRRNSNNGNPLWFRLGAGEHVFDTAGGDIRVETGISGSGASLIKEGDHTLLFKSWSGIDPSDAPNTYDGMTTVAAGTLALAKNAGTVAIAGDLTIGDGTGTDTLRLAANNQIADTSRVGFEGTSAIFRLSGHDETIGGIHSLSVGAGIIENSAGTNCTLTVNSGDDHQFGGVIRDGGSGHLHLLKSGAGVLTLSGTCTHGGGTTIDGGTLRGTASFSGPVTISPGAILSPGGSIGTLTFASTLDLQGSTVMELGREGGLPANDQVTQITTLTLGGSLDVVDVGSELLEPGDSFQLFSASTIMGSFSVISLPPLWNGLSWDVSTLTSDGTIRIIGTPLPIRTTAVDWHGGAGGAQEPASVTLSGTNGTPGFAYTVFSSTDLVHWFARTSDIFDDSGDFQMTLPVDPAQPSEFYRLLGQPAEVE